MAEGFLSKATEIGMKPESINQTIKIIKTELFRSWNEQLREHQDKTGYFQHCIDELKEI